MESIVKLQFRRNLKPLYKVNGLCSFQLIVCDEFNEPYQGSSGDTAELSLKLFSLEGNVDVDKFTTRYKDGIYSISFSMPTFEGLFKLFVDGKLQTPNILLLPLLSDEFRVTEGEVNTFSLPFLSNFRPYSFVSGESIVIREEYGQHIGAHVYDSAIVMIRYLLSKSSFALSSSDVVVELGSGCGLLAIWLAQHYRCQVIATDMIQQLPLLQQNITANHTESNCITKELYWSNQEHCENIFTLVEKKRFVALFAADVLYDQSAIPALANTLSFLGNHPAHEHIPIVYIAQKNRNKRLVEDIRNDLLIYFPNTNIGCEYEEANVIIWSIRFQRF